MRTPLLYPVCSCPFRAHLGSEGMARVGAVAAQAAPQVLERSSQLVDGVVRTANETTPVLEKVVQLKRLLLNIIAALSSAEMRAVLFQEVASV